MRFVTLGAVADPSAPERRDHHLQSGRLHSLIRSGRAFWDLSTKPRPIGGHRSRSDDRSLDHHIPVYSVCGALHANDRDLCEIDYDRMVLSGWSAYPLYTYDRS
jgi:hypothetical protein